MTKKAGKRALKAGLLGALLVALCCFTPWAGVGLGVLGLSVLLPKLDMLLLLLFLGCMTLAGYGWWKLRKEKK